MMETRFSAPIEMSEAEIDVVSGGSFVGIKQSNRGGNLIVKTAGSGGAIVTSTTNNNSQENYNTGSAINTGGVSK
jgi:hypothetical protein